MTGWMIPIIVIALIIIATLFVQRRRRSEQAEDAHSDKPIVP